MQDCQFSETQFSFCFTFEYIKQFFPFVPLPIFPNTVDEGRAGGGYDVQINGNLYFQFKIPVYYDKVSNFWRRDWDVFGHEYYKIKLETDEEQFRLLKILQSPSNEVYYSTPSFHTSADLSTFYSSDNIVANSSLFSIDSLPPHGSGHHHLVYSPAHNWGRLFSDPVDVKVIKAINPFELFPDNKYELTIYEQALRIVGQLREGQFKLSGNFDFNSNQPAQLVRQVYTTLLTDFDVHWYPVISRQQNRRRI